MPKNTDIAEQKIRQLNSIITSYRRGSVELLNENLSLNSLADAYHKFYIKLRAELYTLKEKDKKFLPLFKKVDSFIKEWK